MKVLSNVDNNLDNSPTWKELALEFLVPLRK